MMFDDFLESNWRSSWMMNGSLEWQFLDEYTFFGIGDVEKRAIGIIIDGETTYAASISVTQNEKGKYNRATLSYDFKDVNVESIELKKLDRLENSRRDF